MKIRKVRIGPTKHNPDALTGMGFVNAGKTRRESSSAAGLRDQPQVLPQSVLSFDNLFIADKQ
jgi:hypothetical protein